MSAKKKSYGVLFTPYLEKGEDLIWVGETKRNHSGYSILMVGAGFLAVYSAYLILALNFYLPLRLLVPLFILLFVMVWFMDWMQKRYYAVSNKRLFVLKGNTLIKHDALSRFQKISIMKSKDKGFGLVFTPQEIYGTDKSLYIAPQKFENLTQEDAQTVYDLLQAARNEPYTRELGLMK
jgi:hypothetical protein